MQLVVVLLFFLIGLMLTVKGGDLFVDAAVWFAEAFGIPKYLIGATIVSLATTLPELLVSVMAASIGSTGIAVGNAVGSVTANIGLIMGISLICLPAALERADQAFNLLVMLAGVGLLTAFSIGGALPMAGAAVLLAIFAVYMLSSVLRAKRCLQSGDDRPAHTARSTLSNSLKFVLGTAGVVGGAHLMVSNGAALALVLGVPEAVVGSTLVAVGTSLPELITTLTALSKRQPSLSIGNIVGANIIDLTLILPLCAVISGQPQPILYQNIVLDLPICMALVLLATLPPLLTGRFHKWQGVAMLVGYAGYTALLCLKIA